MSDRTADQNADPCEKCGSPVYGYVEQRCCDGRECGCMGQPLNPCWCRKCWDQYQAESEARAAEFALSGLQRMAEAAKRASAPPPVRLCNCPPSAADPTKPNCQGMDNANPDLCRAEEGQPPEPLLIPDFLRNQDNLKAERAAQPPPAAPADVPTFSFDGEGIYQMYGMTGQYVLTDAYRDVYAALQATKAERDRWWNAAQDRASQPPSATRSELERAAIHYVKVASNPNLSRYITENGRHQDSGGPWAELCNAVRASETKSACCRQSPCLHPGVGPCDMPAVEKSAALEDVTGKPACLSCGWVEGHADYCGREAVEKEESQ